MDFANRICLIKFAIGEVCADKGVAFVFVIETCLSDQYPNFAPYDGSSSAFSMLICIVC